MLEVLILQTQNDPSDERTEFYLRDRRTWIRFLGLGLGDPVPDANTIRTFREALTKADAVEPLFRRFDEALREAGDLAMSTAGTSPSPAFGYQSHIGADRRYRLICTWKVTDAAAHAGARLADLLDPANTASGVCSDTAYRSQTNEALLARRMLTNHIHRKKPRGTAMPARTAKANAKRSAVRASIEHVLAKQKARMGLFVRTIGLARAKTKIGFANLVTNMRRLLWLERKASPA